jgi:tRNA nucleotidyltransferase/poly(A) polymerase
MAITKKMQILKVFSERIRDEFIKGIKSAKSASAFLMLNDKYELFDWIFPDLKIVKSMFNRGDDYMFNDYLVV